MICVSWATVSSRSDRTFFSASSAATNFEPAAAASACSFSNFFPGEELVCAAPDFLDIGCLLIASPIPDTTPGPLNAGPTSPSLGTA